MTISSTGLAPSAMAAAQIDSQTSSAEEKSPQFNNGFFRQELMKRYAEFVQLPDDVRLRHNYLTSHGLSEASLDALPPADRALHEEKVAEMTDQPQLSLAVENDAKGDTLSSPVLTLRAILQLAETPEQETQQVQGTGGLIG